jgi:hypothetical protein
VGAICFRLRGERTEQNRTEQNMNMNKQMIREQAYELWDHAGRPDGRSDEFWFAARAEFEREEETGEGNLGAHVPPHVDPSRHEH